jgi:tetratricopeptide (TPR) repeat protein
MMAMQRLPLATFGTSIIRMFSSANVVDEMIAYARTNYNVGLVELFQNDHTVSNVLKFISLPFMQNNFEQAMDILKSGLGFQQTGVNAGRLHLAQAEILADRSHWIEVSQLCRQAAAAASETQPSSPTEALIMAEVELSAALIGTRASLTQHKDAEAFQMAQQCLEVARKSFTATGAEDQRWQGIVLSHAIAALAQHAACDFETAAESFDEVMSIADHTDQRGSPNKPNRDYLIADALKQVAAFRLCQNRPTEAAMLASRAVEAAKKAAESAKSSTKRNNNDEKENEGSISTDPMLPPTLCAETVIDCQVLLAQSAMDTKDWETAENRLSEALSGAEEVSSASTTASSVGGKPHPRIAIVLLLLAHVYSRTGKVTLAEGLYREIVKILDLNPATESSSSLGGVGGVSSLPILQLQGFGPVHPSVSSLAAWRYAQLLTALPRRDTEAAGWHRLAKELYDDAPLRRVLEPASVFGTLDHLQGKGDGGCGIVLDLMTRRALPRAPTDTTVGGA